MRAKKIFDDYFPENLKEYQSIYRTKIRHQSDIYKSNQILKSEPFRKEAEFDFIINLVEMGKPISIIIGERLLYKCCIALCDNPVCETWMFDKDFVTLCKFHSEEVKIRHVSPVFVEPVSILDCIV